MTIENGAGKPLIDGRPDRDNQMESDPDLEDLDGTLEITVTWSDGESYSHTVTHTPHAKVSLTYNNETNRFDATEIEPISGLDYGPGSNTDRGGGD